MAKQDDSVSPEEKLLKVIQEGGEEPDNEAAETLVSTSVPPVPDEAEEPVAPQLVAVGVRQEGAGEEEKPELKLAKRVAAERAAAVGTDEADGREGGPKWIGVPSEPDLDEDASAPGPGPKWALPSEKPAQGIGAGLGLRAFNRWLALAVVIFILFAVFDIWAMLRADSGPIAGPAGRPAGTASGEKGEPPSAGLPAVSKFLAAFGDEPIVRSLTEGDWKPSDGTVVVVKPKPDWEKVARENLDLIGFSAVGRVEEAIVADKQAGRLHFLRPGSRFTAGEYEFEAVRVEDSKVILSKDGKEIEIQ